MAPPTGTASRPGRALAALAAILLVMLIGIIAKDGHAVSPSMWHRNFKILLGLDLTSGTEVALTAQTQTGGTPNAADMATAIGIMQLRVNSSGNTNAQVQKQGTNVINVSIPGPPDPNLIKQVSQAAQLQFRQVYLQAANAGTAVPPAPIPTPTASGVPTPTSGAPAVHTPAPSGSASPHAAGLPGAANRLTELASGARALSPRSGTAVKGKPAPKASPGATPATSPSASPSATAPPAATSTWQQAQGDPTLANPQAKALFNKLNCADKRWPQEVGYTQVELNNMSSQQVVSCGEEPNGVGGQILTKYLLGPVKVPGKDIATASAQLVPQSVTSWEVLLNFKSDGSALFGQLTSQMFAKYHGAQEAQNEVAMDLDGTVVSAPTIRQAIPGQATISGSFDQNSATNLANTLKYGALPLTFNAGSVTTISPQLGHDQLDAGLISAAIGLALVVFYIIFYYRGLAVVAVSSLVIAGLLAYLGVVVLGLYTRYALDLAGIAGLIVAIGITADSFVVFFERLRDEVRDGGRSLRSAVERGWVRARRTILVSDTVSFLAAALLWYFSIGDVKGFAFTLGMITIIDVLLVFTFTKPMLTLLARTKFYGGGHPLSGLDPARLGGRAPWRSSEPPARRVPGRASRPGPAREA